MSEKKTSEAHKADELRGLHDTEEQARGFGTGGWKK